jgi:hypothetical protein
MIACPNCRAMQPVSQVNTGRLEHCPQCRALLMADMYPAFFRGPESGSSGTAVQEQGQAECFNHPGQQAVVPCDGCGRLLCAVCEVKLDGQSLCMSCLSTGRERRRTNLQNQRTLYDSILLALAFWPMVFIFPTIVTAPATLFLAWRYRKAPTSILPRSRIRYWLAALLAALQITGWLIVLIKVLV